MSPFGTLVTTLDQGITTVYSIPTRTFKKLSFAIRRIHTNAKEGKTKVAGVVLQVLNNVQRITPEFTVPTLTDVEKVTTAFISLSSNPVKCGDPGNLNHTDELDTEFNNLNFSNDKLNDILQGSLRFLAEARTSTPSQVISKLLFYLADTMGTSLDRKHKVDLQRAVGEAIDEAKAYGAEIALSTSPINGAVTGVVLSYHEREDLLPWTRSRQIQRSMHYKMPLRPFQATVFLPQPLNDAQTNDSEIVPALRRSCTPQSFPASPSLRSKVLSGFSNYTEDILYRARDELRVGGTDGDLRLKNATFNLGDAHRDILLSCGLHCASRDGEGLHRSVRSTLPVQQGVPVYFEMNFIQCSQPNKQQLSHHQTNNVKPSNSSGHSDRLSEHKSGDEYSYISGDANDSVNNDIGTPESYYTDESTDSRVYDSQNEVYNATANADPDICIGLSTLNFPLNFLVGSRRFSVGLASSGHLVTDSVWLRSSKGENGVEASFCHGSVVGVLVQIIEDDFDIDCKDEPEMVTVFTNFFIDGEPIVGLPDRALEMRIPIDVDIYPTLSICSSSTKVFGHFSTEDIVHGTPEQLSQYTGQESVYALDGSLIYHESVLYS